VTHLLALTGIAALSFSGIFARLAETSPATVTFFRMLYALPVLLLLTRGGFPRDGRTLIERAMAAAGGLILALDLTLWHQAILLIGAGLATVLVSVQVVFVGLPAWFLMGERPTRSAFLVIPGILVGVGLISGLGRADAYGANPVLGVILGVSAGVCYAAFLLLYRFANRRRASPAGPLLDATVGAGAGGFLLGGLDPGFSLEVVFPSHGWLLGLGVLVQTVAWLLITRTLPRLPALETSLLLLLQPMITLLWGVLLLGERFSGVQGLGALCVLGGVGALLLMGGPVRPDLPEVYRRGRKLPQDAPFGTPSEPPLP
jgi:drug/metabolite transporter (DMT)-like permease